MTNIKLKIKNLIFLIKNKFLAFTAFIWSFTKVTAAFYCAICLLFIFESLREWSTYYIFSNSSLYGLILSALLALALMSLPQNKWRHLFFITIALPLFAFNLLEIEHYIMFGERVSYASVITMLNTDPRIAAQFVGDSLNLKTLFGIVLSAAPMLCLLFIGIPYRFYLSLKHQTSVITLYAIFPLALIFVIIGMFIYDYYKELPQYDRNIADAYNDVKDFNERSQRMRQFDLSDITTKLSDKPQVHVIVIGESAYRPELSIYGNTIKTTPFADSIKDKLYTFTDVTSPSAQTAIVLEKVLTLAEENRDRKKIWAEPGLIDFYNAAGFKTYWISAHSMYGLFDNYSHLLQRVKHRVFINQFKKWSAGFSEYKLDSDLLPELDKALADSAPRKVIFLHLMGSHRLYEDRYPPDYQKNNPEFTFNDEEVDDRYITYVKSLHYTDYMLSEIFKRVSKNKDAASFILYFSDHAESVSKYGDGYRHADSSQDPRSLEIPFILWLSDTYKADNAEFVKNFTDYLNRPYETNWAIHSLLELSRISHPKINYQKSIFNPDYTPKKQRRFEEWQLMRSQQM